MPNLIHNNNLREELQQKINQFERVESNKHSLTQAAVVIGVSALNNTPPACILLTRRSSNLRKHAGQYALPGGKVDSGETIIEAALRELQEELGLNQGSNSILGLLDDMPTQSGFNITPVVVWIDSLDKLKPNPDEVASVFQIPLIELKSINLNLSREDADHDLSSTEVTENQNSDSVNDVMSLYLPSLGTTVYSPTAAIIYQFREVALLGKATRVAHFGQPRFAWR